MAQPNHPSDRTGLCNLDTLSSLLRLALELGKESLQERAQQVAKELQQEQSRALSALAALMCAGVLGLLALMSLTACVVVLCWNTYPALALAGLTLLYATLGFCTYRWAMQRCHGASKRMPLSTRALALGQMGALALRLMKKRPAP
jgi:uncharacterized membrane protein YqjE